jgi:NADH:ubiquinone oxidoreductase subunit E
MTYVPTPVVVPQATLQARELAQRIDHTIREYRQNHPNMSEAEILQALQIAQGQSGGARRTRAMIAVMLGLTALLLLGTLLFIRAG